MLRAPGGELKGNPAERAAIQETRALYRHADVAYAPYSCPASGECCQLAARKREPWLWEAEWRVLLEQLAKEGRALPPAREDGACPFLDASGKRCSVYESRPFGCRTFFCERVRGPKREPAEEVNRLWRRLEAVAQKLDPEAFAPLPLSTWHAESGPPSEIRERLPESGRRSAR